MIISYRCSCVEGLLESHRFDDVRGMLNHVDAGQPIECVGCLTPIRAENIETLISPFKPGVEDDLKAYQDHVYYNRDRYE